MMAVSTTDSLPDDIELLKQLVRTREAELARVRAEASGAEALITHLRLTIAKMRRELFGQRSERKAHLLDQMELQLEELEAELSVAIARINDGEFVATPSDFACFECPALDLVCAGPALRGGGLAAPRAALAAG